MAIAIVITDHAEIDVIIANAATSVTYSRLISMPRNWLLIL